VQGTPRVLDLGCGAGRLAEAFQNRCKAYLGVDASAQMITTARRRFPEMEFAVSDILQLDLPPKSIDVILLMHNVLDSLHPFERRANLLKQASKWLTSNGLLICSSHLLGGYPARGYYSEDYHGVQVSNYRSSMKEYIDEIESSGLEVLMAMKDFRDGVADWTYSVSRPQ
jgi:ubiquinone/menaquinone biosynthesis C-methylase UbiE